MTQPKRPGGRRKKKNAGRWAVVGVALVLAALAAAFGLAQWITNRPAGPVVPQSDSLPPASVAPAVSAPPVSVPVPEDVTQRVTVSAVGDNLVHDGLFLQARARAGGGFDDYDFGYCFENVKYFFEQFDVNWMNQETLLNNAFPPTGYPYFSTPGQMGHATYNAGWRVFSISNNHTYDYGAAGIAATLEFWRGMPEDVLVTGLYTSKEDDSGIKLQETNGMTVAYLAYTDHTNYVADPVDPEAFVIYSSELADAVVVGVHWEQENSHTIIESQRTLAGHLADWGATVVIGTHPHVIQPIEYVTGPETGRSVPVAFSLGNFISGQAQANQMVGLAFAFDLVQTVEHDGTRHPVEVENVRAYPTVTHYDAGYANGRTYMLRDYTDELAAAHGVRARYAGFTVDYVRGLCQQYIDAQFLVLD